jgi:hypothetical protein
VIFCHRPFFHFNFISISLFMTSGTFLLNSAEIWFLSKKWVKTRAPSYFHRSPVPVELFQFPYYHTIGVHWYYHSWKKNLNRFYR